MKKGLNIFIDGPSRSGKLLLAKLLLASPRFSFQHYSGDLERLVELIYFSRNNDRTVQVLRELLRINLAHTIEDLKNARQLSINKSDSSFYKKSSFYIMNKSLFDSGDISSLSGDGTHGFILHTHESDLFLEFLRSSPLFDDIFVHFLHRQVSIIRNPASQALSWLSRRYIDSWTSDSLSSFILYPCKYNIDKLSSSGIKSYPWYVEKTIDYYLDKQMISASAYVDFNDVDIITLSVCYLTEIYLSSFDRLSQDNSSCHRFLVYHENLHDQPSVDVKAILSVLGLEFDSNVLDILSKNEASPKRFGKSSTSESLNKLLKIISCREVGNVLNTTYELYQAKLNRL